jgi:hypothetical protein
MIGFRVWGEFFLLSATPLIGQVFGGKSIGNECHSAVDCCESKDRLEEIVSGVS